MLFRTASVPIAVRKTMTSPVFIPSVGAAGGGQLQWRVFFIVATPHDASLK